MKTCIESDVHSCQGARVSQTSVYGKSIWIGIEISATRHIDPYVGVRTRVGEGGSVVVNGCPRLS